MAVNTMIDRIQELHRANPFRPFEMKLDDGRQVIIDRPEFLGVFPNRSKIFYSTPEDTTEVLEVTHVTDIASHEAGRPRRKNKEGGR